MRARSNPTREDVYRCIRTVSRTRFSTSETDDAVAEANARRANIRRIRLARARSRGQSRDRPHQLRLTQHTGSVTCFQAADNEARRTVTRRFFEADGAFPEPLIPLRLKSQREVAIKSPFRVLAPVRKSDQSASI